MKIISKDEYNISEVISELIDGSGLVYLPKIFNKKQVEKARDIIINETQDGIETGGSHFNQRDSDVKEQRRVWNLINIDNVFVEMVTHPKIISIMGEFLGTDFVMGSICASRTMPGFKGQEPHIDYPYWDFYREKSFPSRINSTFPLNGQATIIIDPFTEKTGATAYKPGSQKILHYPKKDDNFFENFDLMLGNPGDLILFNGAVWHCAMPNKSKTGRIGILIEFLPKFVKPVEDMLTDLDQEFIEKASPIMRQLLGLNYPWPSTPPHHPLEFEKK